MGATIDSGTKGSRNVHLNIVPFIDLMSCLTAFLLVTAVWTNLAQISIEPKGISRIGEATDIEEVRASVLVSEQEIWVGLSRLNEFQKIDKVGGDYNWEALREALVAHKAKTYFTGRKDIELAAEDNVSYSHLVTAMDMAISAGFEDVGMAEPNSLSARPQI